MEKVNNSYECMFIVSLANGDEAAKATVSKFTGLIEANAEVIAIDDWGKLRFAYPINDMNEGYYTVVTFKSAGDFPAEMQRLMNIDEAVLRAMVITIDEAIAAKAAEAPAAAEEAAAAPAAEVAADAE